MAVNRLEQAFMLQVMDGLAQSRAAHPKHPAERGRQPVVLSRPQSRGRNQQPDRVPAGGWLAAWDYPATRGLPDGDQRGRVPGGRRGRGDRLALFVV